ncbi:MAG TPA: hypothetical protein VG167_18820 [Verrucomicrobiae bacterium]|nr:hypothetical protein [Verrucomicrobiae bacterium]
MKKLIGLVIALAVFTLTVTWKPHFTIRTSEAQAAQACVTQAVVTYWVENCNYTSGYTIHVLSGCTPPTYDGYSGWGTYTFTNDCDFGGDPYSCTNAGTWAFGYSAGPGTPCCPSSDWLVASLTFYYQDGEQKTANAHLPAGCSSCTWKFCEDIGDPCVVPKVVPINAQLCSGGGGQGPTRQAEPAAAADADAIWFGNAFNATP